MINSSKPFKICEKGNSDVIIVYGNYCSGFQWVYRYSPLLGESYDFVIFIDLK